METSVIITTVLFLAAMSFGFVILKYMERRLGLIRETEEKEEANGKITKPPTSLKLDDIDYMVEWFVRRDKKINDPLLTSMDIVENLAEETKLELDLMKTKKHKFNRYIGDLIDFLPKVEKAESVLTEYYRVNQNHKSVHELDDGEAKNGASGLEDISGYYLNNIKSYIIAKIRILGWLYYIIFKKWYNQRDSEYLDFTEYFQLEPKETEH